MYKLPPVENLMPMGAPTLYTKQSPKEMIDWFKRDDYDYHGKEVSTVKDGIVKLMEREACDYPTLAGYARHLGVNRSTLHNWSKEYPDFFHAMEHCKEIQQDLIIKHSLKGNYNSSMAKFIMTNCMGYKDKIETVNENKNIEIKIDSEDAEL